MVTRYKVGPRFALRNGQAHQIDSIRSGVPLQIPCDVTAMHPRCNNCRQFIAVGDSVQLEYVRTRHVLPCDGVPAKTLHIISASVHVLGSCAHPLNFHQALLISGPQDFYCYRLPVPCTLIDLGECSGGIRYAGERYGA
jgi:hypothetical protein